MMWEYRLLLGTWAFRARSAMCGRNVRAPVHGRPAREARQPPTNNISYKDQES